MTHYFFGISWAHAHYFFLIALVGCIAALAWWRLKSTRRVMRILVLAHAPLWRYRTRALLIVVGFFALFVAVLRPQWGQKEQIIQQEGRDLFIALDVSRSMLATDCKPSRLALAKKKIKELLPLLQCERVGLILFSGSAFIQCPLTVDYQAFNMFLDSVDAETISSGTTDLAQPVYKAVEAYRSTPNKATKLLVIFTDGEDFSANLSHCKEYIAQENLKVFTLGVGTKEGAPIPLFDMAGKQIGHQKDQFDKVVISRLNEETLQHLSQGAGSMYIQLTADEADIKTLVARVQSFQKEMMEERNIELLEDKYHYFLLMSFICFALEWIL